MELLIFLFKSGLPLEEISATSEKRADRYRKVKGLIQKYYVQDKSTGHVGGVFIFDSKQSLQAFRNRSWLRALVKPTNSLNRQQQEFSKSPRY